MVQVYASACMFAISNMPACPDYHPRNRSVYQVILPSTFIGLSIISFLGRCSGCDLEKRDLDRGLAPAAIEFQLKRINAAAIDHHEISRPAVADVAATSFHFHKHIVSGRFPQRVDRIARHAPKKEHIPAPSRAYASFQEGPRPPGQTFHLRLALVKCQRPQRQHLPNDFTVRPVLS
ncbi:hypothetical protein [Mesorhizobium sp. LNHC209A00]|uniref:hypothetical protein n=1 Tax=Mesorhizobium TaxID=68287 RepID=UPI0012EB7E61|nr:hypothetical protein [Mesorhizobium sp. LNHC209A00]